MHTRTFPVCAPVNARHELVETILGRESAAHVDSDCGGATLSLSSPHRGLARGLLSFAMAMGVAAAIQPIALACLLTELQRALCAWCCHRPWSRAAAIEPDARAPFRCHAAMDAPRALAGDTGSAGRNRRGWGHARLATLVLQVHTIV